MRYIVISAIGIVAIAFATRASAVQSSEQLAGAARADTVRLTLEEAERMALEQNAAFLAAQTGIDVARGELRQARALAPNPQAEFEALNTGGERGGYRSSLTQELEIGGQQSARAGAAAAALARTEYLGADAARGLLRDVRAAFFRSLAARRRLNVMEDMLVLQNRLLDAVRIQLAEGEISALDANLAEVEVGRAHARLLAARRLQAEAEHELKTQLGFPPQQVLALVAPDSLSHPDAAGVDSLVSLALGRRPDLAAMNAAVEQASRMASLANRSSIPNPTVGVLAEQEDATG
ncbi:MAG: TolC family protein, partial [Longimicrobiales bacterium]